MNDDLLVPDRRIVSIDEARESPEKKKPRGMGDASDFVTRRELVTIVEKINGGISDAALAVGQKVFDEIEAQNTEVFARMHHNIRREILAELDARSLRGRIRRRALQFRDWARGYLMELGVVSPIAERPDVRLVDAVEALDPNVQFAANDDGFLEIAGTDLKTPVHR